MKIEYSFTDALTKNLQRYELPTEEIQKVTNELNDVGVNSWYTFMTKDDLMDLISDSDIPELSLFALDEMWEAEFIPAEQYAISMLFTEYRKVYYYNQLMEHFGRPIILADIAGLSDKELSDIFHEEDPERNGRDFIHFIVDGDWENVRDAEWYSKFKQYILDYFELLKKAEEK